MGTNKNESKLSTQNIGDRPVWGQTTTPGNREKESVSLHRGDKTKYYSAEQTRSLSAMSDCCWPHTLPFVFVQFVEPLPITIKLVISSFNLIPRPLMLFHLPSSGPSQGARTNRTSTSFWLQSRFATTAAL